MAVDNEIFMPDFNDWAEEDTPKVCVAVWSTSSLLHFVSFLFFDNKFRFPPKNGSFPETLNPFVKSALNLLLNLAGKTKFPV